MYTVNYIILYILCILGKLVVYFVGSLIEFNEPMQCSAHKFKGIHITLFLCTGILGLNWRTWSQQCACENL